MSDSNGGSGGNLFTNPKHMDTDLKLIQRAVNNRWNIPADLKKKIIERMAVIIEASDDDELAMKASSLLISADRNDVSRERNDVEADKPAQGTSNITQINYNRLSAEELLKLLELCQKAGVPSAIPDEPNSKSEPGRNGHINGTG